MGKVGKQILLELATNYRLYITATQEISGFTMKVLAKRLLVILWFSFLLANLFPLKGTPEPLPIGFLLTYQIIDDINGGWREQYEILDWAPELGESVLFVDFASTKEDAPQGTFGVDVSSWALLYTNGTLTDQLIQPPLWIDPSDWHEGNIVNIPTYNGEYCVSSEFVSGSFGTFLCWRINTIAWLSVDDDYQRSNENWYFHYSLGVLVKYTCELLASQHAVYTFRVSKELLASNFSHFGILSFEEQSVQLLQSLELMVALLLPIVIGSVLLYRYYRTIRHR